MFHPSLHSRVLRQLYAATYTYVYAFLVKQGQKKAAEALKKAAKDVVVLKDGVEAEGPSLERIVKEWKELKEKAKKVAA